MRFIRIENCDYVKYEAMRDLIMSKEGFAILNDQYSAKLQTATFYFWGLEYIPPELHQYVVQPPVDLENWEALRKGLRELFPREEQDHPTCLLCLQKVQK